MEFSFDINELFPHEISVIDNQLRPMRSEKKNWRQLKAHIGEVIDVIGEASARAQQLDSPITTREKFVVSDNRIYIKKNSLGNNNKGGIIGFLKVGTKKLFLFDLDGIYHELEPLCVLDFYVHESIQRQGCGKQLFEFMLAKEKIGAHHLAINRPSPKLSAFLSKHYGLRKIIPQVNKFVIFSNFFLDRQVQANKRQWNYDDQETPSETQIYITPTRPTSLGGCRKSRVPTLPNISGDTRNASANNSVFRGRTGLSAQCSRLENLRATDMERTNSTNNIPHRGKYLTDEIFELGIPRSSETSPFREFDRRSHNSSSTSQLNYNHRFQDTAWNIFGVSGTSCRPREGNRCVVQKYETLFR